MYKIKGDLCFVIEDDWYAHIDNIMHWATEHNSRVVTITHIEGAIVVKCKDSVLEASKLDIHSGMFILDMCVDEDTIVSYGTFLENATCYTEPKKKKVPTEEELKNNEQIEKEFNNRQKSMLELQGKQIAANLLTGKPVNMFCDCCGTTGPVDVIDGEMICGMCYKKLDDVDNYIKYFRT